MELWEFKNSKTLSILSIALLEFILALNML